MRRCLRGVCSVLHQLYRNQGFKNLLRISRYVVPQHNAHTVLDLMLSRLGSTLVKHNTKLRIGG